MTELIECNTARDECPLCTAEGSLYGDSPGQETWRCSDPECGCEWFAEYEYTRVLSDMKRRSADR